MVNYLYQDYREFPHVRDLKKLSSLYSAMFVACFIFNCPNLSSWLTAWLVHCIPMEKKSNQMLLSTTDAQCFRLPVQTLTAGLTELTVATGYSSDMSMNLTGGLFLTNCTFYKLFILVRS